MRSAVADSGSNVRRFGRSFVEKPRGLKSGTTVCDDLVAELARHAAGCCNAVADVVAESVAAGKHSCNQHWKARFGMSLHSHLNLLTDRFECWQTYLSCSVIDQAS